MAEITLVRLTPEPISDADRDAVRRVMFGVVDGLGEINKRRWRRHINGLLRLEPGESVDITTRKPRNGPFHQRHMVLETRVFEQQERFENFDPGFRDWLKIGAGHCTWVPGPKGGIVPIPKSISYLELEDEAMREFHEKAVAFLRTEHAAKTLWPRLTPARRLDAIEAILSAEFRE